MQYFFFDDPDLAFDYLTVTRWVGSLGPPYDSPFGPSTYLGFAADDLAGGDERGLVNAFGNVKRCLHLSVDTLLHQYALFPYARRLAFPDRLALLDRIDVLPTSSETPWSTITCVLTERVSRRPLTWLDCSSSPLSVC
jgi:hypothetical protein